MSAAVGQPPNPQVASQLPKVVKSRATAATIRSGRKGAGMRDQTGIRMRNQLLERFLPLFFALRFVPAARRCCVRSGLVICYQVAAPYIAVALRSSVLALSAPSYSVQLVPIPVPLMSSANFALLAFAVLASACGNAGEGASAHVRTGTATAVATSRSIGVASIPSFPDAHALHRDSIPSSSSITSSVRLASAESDSIGKSAGRRTVNELGRIPILEYHLVGESDSRWMVERGHFRKQLQLLYERGYRPITVSELVDGKIDLGPGQSPVVFTFDDASPSQFSYIERDGRLEVDSNSAVGIWLTFAAQHPDWGKKATFCMLSGAAAGRSFFGDKGIEGQKTEWRLKKVRFLAEQGFELCNHTLWHANLANYADSMVRQQIARGDMAIDSAVAGYQVRTFALPLGVWPKNHELVRAGSWRDAKSGREIRYKYDAVLLVAGGPARSPFDPLFDPYRLPRVQVYGNELEKALEQLERSRYVASGVSRNGRARSVQRSSDN